MVGVTIIGKGDE